MLQIIESLNRIYVKLLKSMLPIIKKEGLSNSEMIVLWKIHRKGTYRATDLASETGIPPSTFTGIFDRLVSRNLLQRINDPEDRRSILVGGTPELKLLMGRVADSCEEKLKDMFKGMPEELSGQFVENLQQVEQYLSGQEGCDKVGGQHSKH